MDESGREKKHVSGKEARIVVPGSLTERISPVRCVQTSTVITTVGAGGELQTAEPTETPGTSGEAASGSSNSEQNF